jgi:hypothetical protein
MKLTNNHKILIGLAIGGGIAWLLTRKKSATASSTPSTAKSEDLTREEKINFILNTIEPNATEVSTGFSGDRFEYDPKLGYALPIGTVDVVSAGGEVVLPREGNLAQEVFFNADGEPTNNPIEEAEGILDTLTDEELNVAFKVSQARVNNPNLTDDAIIKIANVDEKGQGLFLGIIRQKLNDLKAMSKNPNWKKGLGKRRQMRKEMMGMTREERQAYRQEKRQQRELRRQNRSQSMGQRKPLFGGGNKRPRFTDEVIYREKGSMWGGYRNDGKPTNAMIR